MESLLKADPRWCVLSVFIFSLLMVTFFVIRLTNSKDIIRDQDVLNESNISTEPGLLLVLIHASGKGVKVRNAIRNTWVSPSLLGKLDSRVRGGVKYRFVLGVQGMPEDLLSSLTEEAMKHRDMIFLPEVSDEHQSLSYRTLRSFQYVAQNKDMDFLYVLKCDDDTFINLLAVTSELSRRTTDTGFFWGQFLGAGGIIQEGPYSEFGWSVCDTYLPYALGGGYLLSMDLVELVARNAPFLKVYRNEDVSVGAWLAPYNIDFVSDSRFNTGAVTKGCKKPYIVIHRVNTTLMYNYANAVLKDGYICNRKNHWFVWHGYRYNWKTKPSRCCRIRRKIP